MMLVSAIAIGTAIGAGIGVLFAPEKGRKTRKKLKRSAESAKKDASAWLKDSKEKVAKTAKDQKNKIKDKIEDAL